MALVSTLPYAVWRDVLFVHAAPIAGGRLVDLEEGDLQLWDAGTFLRSAGLGSRVYRRYGADGIERAVVGHIPQDLGPTFTHAGRTLLLDANACGLRTLDGDARTAYACLARIAPAGDLSASALVLVDTSLEASSARRPH